MSHTIKLSVIIPFSQRAGDSDAIRRLDNAIGCFAEQTAIEVVVCDAGRCSSYAKLSNRQQANLRYIHHYESGVFSPGHVRNRAIDHAVGRYIFLMDADLLINQALISKLLRYVDDLTDVAPQIFYMFPCLYLSQDYSAQLTVQPPFTLPNYQLILESYLRGERDRVDGIALASSCLLINRQWFLAIGGFRNEFIGHGYEDFELIHRLTTFYPIAEKPADYWLDIKNPFPAHYQGFRRYFSFYAVPHLFIGEFLLHQWHPRPLTRQYHRKRKDNERHFSALVNDNESVSPSLPKFSANTHIFALLQQGAIDNKVGLPDFSAWLQIQQQSHGFAYADYPGLFYAQRSTTKQQNGLQRKIRKLLLNPHAFFRDSKLYRVLQGIVHPSNKE